ncbi:nuclear transport factor 2 family protein [Neobacillus sp. SCS-31]|uniref:nuclear transport factor 2 family protein n=1 Tax=Neobacillus oceani TaxID=3115292 RepID=UPI003905FAFC
MKQYSGEVNEFDREFKSMNKKISLTKVEQNHVFEQVNARMGDGLRKQKNPLIPWKFMIAASGAALLFIILVMPGLLSGVLINSGKAMTAIQAVEKHYEAYNNRDYDAYYDLQSKRLMETQEKQTGMTREEFIKSWKGANFPTVEVKKIQELNTETEEGTIVSATVYVPISTRGAAYTEVTTFKVIKEDGEWKIDEVVSVNRIN